MEFIGQRLELKVRSQDTRGPERCLVGRALALDMVDLGSVLNISYGPLNTVMSNS